jgi:hypothetical protein
VEATELIAQGAAELIALEAAELIALEAAERKIWTRAQPAVSRRGRGRNAGVSHGTAEEPGKTPVTRQCG